MRIPLGNKQRSYFAIFAIGSVIIIAACFEFQLNQHELAVAFASYAVILLQSRVQLSRFIHGFSAAPIITRLLRYGFSFLPLLFIRIPKLNSLQWGIPVAIAWAIALQFPSLPDFKITISSEFAALLPPLSRMDKFRNVLHPILSAIAEEFFYRGVLLNLLRTYIGPWAILVVSISFVLEHFLQRNAPYIFTRRDYIFQLLLSLGLSTVFYLSESLLGCMLGHVVYNLPETIQTLMRNTEPIQSKTSE